MIKTANVGPVDRMFRLIAGIILLLLPFIVDLGGSWLGWAAPIVGIILMLTGFLRFCPAYTLLGIKTCQT
ncbi:MAG: DUF2892 domain-containing protein [Geminicoccaceae bacterium]|nr:DUF2892 domain-containing protein [Geminicoccaceae bacterium]